MVVQTNGSSVWVRWLVGTLWGVEVAVILFMGNIVNANDKTNTADHKNMRLEVLKQDKELKQEIMADIKEIRKEQKILLVQTTEIATILKGWEPSD